MSLSGCICATLTILGMILLLFYFEKDDISFKRTMFIPRFPGMYQGESSIEIFKRGRAFSIKNNKLLFGGLLCGFISGLNILLFFIPVIWSEYFDYKDNETYKLMMNWWKIYFLSYLPIGMLCLLLDRVINGPLIPGRNNTKASKNISNKH